MPRGLTSAPRIRHKQSEAAPSQNEAVKATVQAGEIVGLRMVFEEAVILAWRRNIEPLVHISMLSGN